jgi:hypothetical protein
MHVALCNCTGYKSTEVVTSPKHHKEPQNNLLMSLLFILSVDVNVYNNYVLHYLQQVKQTFQKGTSEPLCGKHPWQSWDSHAAWCKNFPELLCFLTDLYTTHINTGL